MKAACQKPACLRKAKKLQAEVRLWRDLDRMRGEHVSAADNIPLWYAVLESGLYDVRTASEPVKTSALEWFQSDDEGPGTAAWICAMLGKDLSKVRRRACVLYITGHNTRPSRTDQVFAASVSDRSFYS